MLDIVGRSRMTLCDGITRRRALQAGTLGPLAVGLPDLLSAAASSQAGRPNSTFGRARRVILLFMWGGPAHQDTWDLKPDGPADLRGEFLPIGTNVPGLHISEHFPLIARQADKLAVIRSVGQEDNNHSTGAHAGLTGRRHEQRAENFGARDTDFPHYGSVLSRLNPARQGMPTFVSLPDVIATTSGVITPGQFGGMLGRKFDPFQIIDHPDRLDFSIESLRLPSGLNDARMQHRRSLLNHVDRIAAVADRSRSVAEMSEFHRQALDMVLSSEARRAFDLSRVDDDERWRYGWHTFGQSVLMARRLIESGVRLVTVYWHREKKTVDSSWDTHALNFQEMRNRLMPSVDRPIAALLDDLAQSGLLDETLVVWNSEFGRTPKINRNAGRDHWGPCNSVVMAGGGVPGGQVFGASDEAATYPARDKVTQDDIAATIYHLLGYDPHTTIQDRLGRPFPLSLGEPIHKLLGNACRPEPIAAPAPLPARPRPGPFERMLKFRGGRYLCCELNGNDGEREWTLTDFGSPSETSGSRFRQVSATGATLKYDGHFYGHFDYAFAVLKLAEARRLDDSRVLINGQPIATDVIETTTPNTLWQIPLPDGFIKSQTSFELRIEAKNWPVSAFALVGDEVLDHHLQHLLT